MSARIDRVFRFVLPAALVVTLAASAPALAQEPEPRTYRAFPYVTVAGDLDGDGLADTMTNQETWQYEVPGVGVFLPTPSIEARKGTDGSSLWQRDAEADALLPAPLGEQAAPSVLVVDGAITGMVGYGFGQVGPVAAYTEAGQLRALDLTALDGSGQVVWERAFDEGAYGGAAVVSPPELRHDAVVARRYPLFHTLLQATPSPALDALVTILDRTEVDGEIETSLTVAIVDGADGDVASQRAFDTQGSTPGVLSAGDLDGDRLDDVLLTRYPNSGQLTALRGHGLQTLWTNPDDVVPFESFAEDLGDVTGDGIDDVAVRGFGDWFDEDPPTVAVFDGADGSLLFETVATSITSVGLIPGGSAGLVTQLYDYLDGDVEYRLLDAGGGQLALRHVSVADPDDVTVTAESGVGDLDGDGVRDVGHVVRRYSDDAGWSEQRTYLSGRTLATLIEDAGMPLGTSLDGTGADLLLVERTTAASLDVTAQTVSGSPLWTRTLTVDGSFPSTGRIHVKAADMSGDATPEVILNVEAIRRVETPGGGSSSESTKLAWVLNGKDGSTLWSV